MSKKIFNLFSGLPMTIISGIALLISLSFYYYDINLKIDPAWIAIIICGTPLLYLSITRLIHNKGISKISSALLITIAMFAAIIIGDIFAAGEVAFIMSIGAILEEKTTQRAKNSLKNLINLNPETARLIRNNSETIIKSKDIQKGDIIKILPGEIIATDGDIIDGNTSIDQSIITGESLPIDKTTGEEVFCGTKNLYGSIDIVATKVGKDNSLNRLILLVKEAREKKANIARIADVVASYLVPIALLIAIISYIYTKNIITAVTILVVFCPCSLVLSTPTAIIAAIGKATKKGIIIKSGEALEKMAKIDAIAFDKTGTLTTAKLKVTDIISFDDLYTENNIISICASVETRSEHPLAKTIVKYSTKNNIKLLDITDFKMSPGKGVMAKLGNDMIICGNKKYIVENNILLSNEILENLDKLQKEGKSSILISKNNKCIGVISLSDNIKDNSKTVINNLRNMGLKTYLITGDNKNCALYTAGLINIDNVSYSLLPEEKANEIYKIKKENNVCMVGDGINDAIALETADVSIAMGSIGSDIAINSSDITLMNDNIENIIFIKKLADETLKTIKLSISLSMTINFIAIILSLMNILNPTTGALVHNVGSVIVLLIAAFLYDKKIT